MCVKDCPPDLQHILNYCVAALKSGRPLNKAMIFMAGKTGAGKSTTINTLFDDNNLCKTSSTTSTTNDVLEYVKLLHVTSDPPTIQGKISIVDVPGTLDTNAANEERNFAAIAKFCEDHNELGSINKTAMQKIFKKMGDAVSEYGFDSSYGVREMVYPNVVLFTVEATDDRMCGPDSDMQKCLKSLHVSGIIDKHKVNLIVVVTKVAKFIPIKKYR